MPCLSSECYRFGLEPLFWFGEMAVSLLFGLYYRAELVLAPDAFVALHVASK